MQQHSLTECINSPHMLYILGVQDIALVALTVLVGANFVRGGVTGTAKNSKRKL